MDSAVLAFLLGVSLTLAAVWLRRTYSNAGRILAEAELVQVKRELAARRGEVEQLRALFSTALRAFPQPVFVTTRDRVILLANPAALKLAGLEPDQVVGSVVARVIQDYETTRLLMEAARANERQEREFFRPATGETWHVAITPLSLDESAPTDKHTAAAIGLAVAATSSPIQRRQGAHAPTHLILTIEDLTELRRLETIRRDFVAHVSHELRTPLAAVRLQAETLLAALDGNERGSAPEHGNEFGHETELTTRILDEVDHLTQMVAELLELSRIESGKTQLRREPTELAGLIEVVIDRMRPLAEERGVRLVAATPEGLPDGLVDGRRIEEVLVNLIDNALKYTPPSGTVTLSAELRSAADVEQAFQASTPGVHPRKRDHSGHDSRHEIEGVGEHSATEPHDEGELLVVHASDTGVGIRPDDLPRIFERFYKADRARTRPPERLARETGRPEFTGAVSHAAAGTGLGLAIAKHLVELHGGKIWATSAVGQGSRFQFLAATGLRSIVRNRGAGNRSTGSDAARPAGDTPAGVAASERARSAQAEREQQGAEHRADDRRHRAGEHPGDDHVAGHAPAHRAQTMTRPHAHHRSGDHVRRANRQPELARRQDHRRRCRFR